MKAPAAPKTIAVPASGFWPCGLTIEPTSDGLLLRPARKPRAGWSNAFTRASKADEPELRSLRAAANEFDRMEWDW